MSTFTIRYTAPSGGLFGGDVLDGLRGHRVPLTFDGEPIGSALIEAVEIAEDGRSAHLTLTDAPDLFLGDLDGLSLGVPEGL